MATMPIRTTNPPSSIKGQPNGAIPMWLLSGVDEKTGYNWMMAELPARGMRALHAAVYKEFGVRLSSVGRGRSFETQRVTFEQRHTPVSLAVYNTTAKFSGVANKRIWPDAAKYGHNSIYWVLKKGFASAAVPGTSPHGMWVADDVCLPGNVGIGNRPDILDWLYRNVISFGFGYSLTSEPWHVQWINGDTVPQRVLDYEKSLVKPEQPVERPPVVVQPPAEPPVNPPPLGDEDVHYEIWTIPGRNAQFLAACNTKGIALFCFWSGPGGAEAWEKGDDVVAGHLGQGALSVSHDIADLKNVFILGPLPQGDGDWSLRNFANPEF